MKNENQSNLIEKEKSTENACFFKIKRKRLKKTYDSIYDLFKNRWYTLTTFLKKWLNFTDQQFYLLPNFCDFICSKFAKMNFTKINLGKKKSDITVANILCFGLAPTRPRSVFGRHHLGDRMSDYHLKGLTLDITFV